MREIGFKIVTKECSSWTAGDLAGKVELANMEDDEFSKSNT